MLAHRTHRNGGVVAVITVPVLITALLGWSGPADAAPSAESAPASAGTVAPPDRADARDDHGNLDLRSSASAAAVRAQARTLRSSQQRQGSAAELGSDPVLEMDPLTGTPRQVSDRAGLLTGPSTDRPVDVALDYVRANLDTFGLTEGDLSSLTLRRTARDVHGITHLSWGQRVDGIPVFGNGLKAHVARDGSLVSLQGAPVSGLAAEAAAVPDPVLSAADGRRAAVADVGARATSTTAADPSDLVYFVTPTGLRLGWSTYTEPASGQAFQHVIDAATGSTLYRHSTVHQDRGDALVFDHYPGARIGGKQKVVNLFKRGFLPRNATWLRGNYAFVWADVNDDDRVQAAERTKVPGTRRAAQFKLKVFQPTRQCTPAYVCTWDPDVPYSWRANRNQDGTQALYLASVFATYLKRAPIGFTPQMGNFENTGGDPVLLQVLDGAATDGGLPDDDHIDNATMNTPPDGVPPTMQMYLNHEPGTGGGANGDPYLPASSSNAADNIFHEYTHGLSDRLVIDAAGNSTLNSLQAGAMGEGWSDYYAMDYLVTKKMLTDTAKPGQLMFDRYLTQNRAITRSEAIDCPVGAVATLCVQAGLDDGGYTLGDLAVATGGPEVHADSEIWSQTLWDLRTRLGHVVTAALVTEAMSLSPADPSFLDARDAILAADQAIYGGRYNAAIWSVFAKRGMGWFASVSGSADTSAVEDFRLPPSPETPRATITGTVTDDQTGEPVAGAVVYLGGHPTYAGVTDAQGAYSISYVPEGDYPELIAHAPAYDLGIVPLEVEAPEVEADIAIRRDWAALVGGAELVDSNGPDYGAGCQAVNALDLDYGLGWASAVTDGRLANEADPKFLEVRLPEPVTITSFGIDPSANCGDGGSASLGDYRIEVSLDGEEYSQVTSGHFEADDRGLLNEVGLDAPLPGVQYVKIWMDSSQVKYLTNPDGSPTDVDCESSDGNGFSGCRYIDMTEFEVYGATGEPASEDLQLLSFNDFHGHLEATDPPLSTTVDPSQTPAGGVEYLSAAVKAQRAEQPDSTLTVAAGDLIGGSTFLSGLFQDQPSIEAMEELGLDVSSVGNHEFDEGTDELLRIVDGGCYQGECFQDSQGEDIPYDGADFDYLAANVLKRSDGQPLLPPTSVKEVDGIPVGFIGMTLEATPTLVSPTGVASVDFLDEVETANAQASALKAQGVESIVVLLHEGGTQSGTFNDCVGISGAIVDIAEQITPEVDMLVTGHTHQPYTCSIDDPAGNPRLVTSAASYGQVLTESHLEIDRATREVLRDESTAENHLVVRTVAADAAQTAIINFWKTLSAPIAAEVVGTLAPATDILGDSSTCRCEETPMTDLVADAMLAGTEDEVNGGAQIALMNTGGVRASLRYTTITNGEQPGEITYAETYAVAPFNNILVTLDLTGAQIEDVLNQQYQPVTARGSRPMLSLGVSAGFSYTWEWEGAVPAPNTQPGAGTTGGHVVPGSMTLDGVPLEDDQTYRVATLNFLADGGDLFTAFAAGTNKVGGPEDLPNLAQYFRDNPGLTPPPGRVTGL